MNTSIHPETRIGAVSLTITDLARSVAYYQRLGLTLHRQNGTIAYLGAGDEDLLILHENKNGRSPQRTTGLYHFAILLPSRLNLAQALNNMAQQQIPLQGYSDHLVSEALYLADPDGNGIEVYRDRPREEWRIVDGAPQMDTVALDIQSLIGELEGQPAQWEGFHKDTTIGHVHLHVSQLLQAESFYTNMLGFDLVTRYGPSASFVSAGGYHHHIGMNTWAGVNIPPPPADAVGLRWFELKLPHADALDQVKARLAETAVPTTPHEKGILIHDPAQNGILFTAA